MKELQAVMGVREGVIAFVGGGGKTTCIYRLADELRAKGHPIIITTTTKMYIPEDKTSLLLDPTREEVRGCLMKSKLSIVASKIEKDKIIGIDSKQVDKLKDLADFVLVEADGSKRMPIKVPRDYEPVVPECANQVVAVIGVSALGKKISHTCCRSQEVAAFLGKAIDENITVEDLYKIITSKSGLAKGIEGKNFQVLLNQIDACEEEWMAIHTLAKRLVTKGISQVVMSSLHQLRWEGIRGGIVC